MTSQQLLVQPYLTSNPMGLGVHLNMDSSYAHKHNPPKKKENKKQKKDLKGSLLRVLTLLFSPTCMLLIPSALIPPLIFDSLILLLWHFNGLSRVVKT